MKKGNLLKPVGALSLAAVPFFAPSFSVFAAALAPNTPPKISHHFHGGRASEGDFSDGLVRKLVAEEKRTRGGLSLMIDPVSLLKTVAPFPQRAPGRAGLGADFAVLSLVFADMCLRCAFPGAAPGLPTMVMGAQ